MKTDGLSAKTLLVKEPLKSSAPKPARNLIITAFVVTLLLGAAAISVWQLNVGGTGQWITWTLTGSSAAALGLAIGAMIYHYKNLQESSTPVLKTPKKQKAAPQPQERTIAQPKVTPHVAAAASQSIIPAGLPKADVLKARGLTPLSEDPAHPKKLSFIAQAILLEDVPLVRDYLNAFPWKPKESSQLNPFLSSSTPPYILQMISNKLLESIKQAKVDDRELYHISVPSHKTGVSLVTLEMLQEAAKKCKDNCFCFSSLVDGYHEKIDLEMIIEKKPSDNPQLEKLLKIFPDVPGEKSKLTRHDHPMIDMFEMYVRPHNLWIEKRDFENFCKKGENPAEIIRRMNNRDLQLNIWGPRHEFETLDGKKTTVFALLIGSGKVACIEEFIKRMHFEGHFFILPEDLGKGSAEMNAYLQKTYDQQQQWKAKKFDDLAFQVTKNGRYTQARFFTQWFKESGLNLREKAWTGPYTGKTILQLALETEGADQALEGLLNAESSLPPLDVHPFFLGYASDLNLVLLSRRYSIQREFLHDKKVSDLARLDALHKCCKLVEEQDDAGQFKIMNLMEEHGLQPDTRLPGMKCKTIIETATEMGMLRESYKKLVVMHGRPSTVVGKHSGIHSTDVIAIHKFEQSKLGPPLKTIPLFQMAVEANAHEIVKILVEFMSAPERKADQQYRSPLPIDTTKFFLARCSDETLQLLSTVTQTLLDALKAQRQAQAPVEAVLKLIKPGNQDQVIKAMDSSQIKPNDLVHDGKMLIQIVAEKGDAYLDILKALVKKLNGKRVLPIAAMYAYPTGSLDTTAYQELNWNVMMNGTEENSKENT